MKFKVLLLYSGGLDSILSYKILKKNNFVVEPIQFYTPFLHIKDKDSYIENQKKYYDVDLKLIDVSKDYLDILINPQYGYGKNLNPCLDCKLYFYKKAKQIMEKEGFDFLATGEVVGQRPFSQKENTLNFLENKSGLKGRIIRPLSFKKERIVSNHFFEKVNFYKISGRDRGLQLKLAKEFSIEPIPTPSGGCLLTEPSYVNKVINLIKFFDREDIDFIFFEFLKFGRVFFEDNYVLIIGRNKIENNKLINIFNKAKSSKICLVKIDDAPAPDSIVIFKENFKENKKVIDKIKNFIKPHYHDKLKFNFIEK